MVRTMVRGKTLVKKNHDHVIVLESASKGRFCGTYGPFELPTILQHSPQMLKAPNG